MQHADHTDLQWLERNRKCLTCQSIFPTAELGNAFVWELAALREKVKLLLVEGGGALETAQKAAEWLNELVSDLECTLEKGSKSPAAEPVPFDLVDRQAGVDRSSCILDNRSIS